MNRACVSWGVHTCAACGAARGRKRRDVLQARAPAPGPSPRFPSPTSGVELQGVGNSKYNPVQEVAE